MGTRSLTRVIPRQKGLSYSEGHLYPEKAVVNMYRQYDGYPEGHGVDLAIFLKENEEAKFPNETGCLAARLVKHFSQMYQYIFLEKCDNEERSAEYIYTLYPKLGEPTYVAIYKVFTEEVIFVGTFENLQSKYDYL